MFRGEGGTTMANFWKRLFGQRTGLGFSATLPELDGMP